MLKSSFTTRAGISPAVQNFYCNYGICHLYLWLFTDCTHCPTFAVPISSKAYCSVCSIAFHFKTCKYLCFYLFSREKMKFIHSDNWRNYVMVIPLFPVGYVRFNGRRNIHYWKIMNGACEASEFIVCSNEYLESIKWLTPWFHCDLCPESDTFIQKLFGSIVIWILVRFSEQCSWAFYVLGTERLYWQNCQEVGLRPLNCSTKSLGQSIDNRQGEPQGHMECQQTLPGLSSCLYVCADPQIFGIWGNFNLTEMAFLFGLAVWNFLCLLCGWLSMCMQ